MRAQTVLLLTATLLTILGASPGAARADEEEPSGPPQVLAEDPWSDEEPAEIEGDEVEQGAAETEGEGAEAAPEQERITSAASSGEGSLRHSGRMEFDERLVKGQAAKSGAVYLFKRVPRRLPGLVPMRRSYRKRIVQPVLREREIKPAILAGSKKAALRIEKKPTKIDAEKTAVQPTDEESNKAGKKDRSKRSKRKSRRRRGDRR